MSPSKNHLPGKRVSAGLLQHGKRLLERHNNVQKGRGLLVFVAVQDVTIQSFGKKTLKSMSASHSCCSTAANVPVKHLFPRPHNDQVEEAWQGVRCSFDVFLRTVSGLGCRV